MSKKKREQPIVENVTITDVAAEGKSIARINDLVIFVPFVVPGDVVDLKILKRKHSYAEAVAVNIRRLSDVRAVPFCRHFGVCGGCKWQNLPYKEQLRYKQKQVFDHLTRIAKVELPEILPILGSEDTARYRNKLEYSFSNMRWLTQDELSKLDESGDNARRKQPGLGFHIPGAFDKVLHIRECWLQDVISDRIRNSAYKYAVEHEIPFINLRSQEGVLRDMMVRVVTTGQIMVLVQAKIVTSAENEQFMGLMQHLSDSFPEITSLLFVINNKCNDTFGDLDVNVFRGEEFIYETMENLRFKIGPKSFFQTNSRQAYNLYSVVRDFARLDRDDVVYDLYTGTGTIALFIASRVGKVIGIEYVPEAIEDAKVNAELNDIRNVEFYAGDMKDVLNADFMAEHGTPNVIITDPPRAGMHKDVVDVILSAAPERIVYVSCNPATQARDVALLDCEYRVVAVQPIDMFPHTQHVEVVTLLEKRC
ncbi:MAG: 23S rRNA (uracil(1939)-C(5))-methyltransferase RlmD [Bacteroidaceae bacterium]|nr:23S rRNA (uracil(1939)-C(5))-methyltransferase RlmD [Bacteroidaceae bacterium]